MENQGETPSMSANLGGLRFYWKLFLPNFRRMALLSDRLVNPFLLYLLNNASRYSNIIILSLVRRLVWFCQITL